MLHESFVFKLSWATIVVHSRDNKELGMAYETTAPENQLLFSQMTMGQYWIGKTKPWHQFEMLSKAATEC